MCVDGLSAVCRGMGIWVAGQQENTVKSRFVPNKAAKIAGDQFPFKLRRRFSDPISAKVRGEAELAQIRRFRGSRRLPP